MIGSNFEQIDVPFPGVDVTSPVNINDAGVISGSFRDDNGFHGFLYDGVTYTQFDIPFPGADNTFIQGTTTSGQIVGSYRLNGVNRGFLATPGPEPLEHFKCYTVLQRFPRFQSQDVNLVDQFEDKDTTVTRPVTMCNPVNKNGEGINDDTAHLTCFSIADVAGQPPFEARDVIADNQFGEQTITVTAPRSLCVPSEKDVSSTLEVDHFKCYDVEQTGFQPITVTLTDQFETKETLVRHPVAFCTPVDKNDEGIMNPMGHLTCYDIKDVKRPKQPRFERREVVMTNQFGQQMLTVRKSDSLCVPSTKTELP